MTSPPSSPPPPAPFSSELKVDKCILEYLRKRKNEVTEKLRTSTITYEGILDLEPHPSDYRLAHFASEVYNDNCTIPDDCDWKLLIRVTNTSKGNGYVGAAFFNPVQQQIIIAHRGTDSLNAVWTDLKSIVWGSISTQIHSALTFTDFIRGVIVELQSEKSWRYQLSFTGHSLGGFLAQMTTFGVKYLQRYDDDVFLKAAVTGLHGHCVTFDNPGCAEMLDRITDHCDLRYLKTIFPSTLDVTAYLSAPNKVNTCNRHVGVLLRLEFPFQEMSFLTAHTALYHLKVHSMDNIKSVFDPDEVTISVDVDQVSDWPVIGKGLTGIIFNNDEYRNFFKYSRRENHFHPNPDEAIEKNHFNKIRYSLNRSSVESCNVSLFSEDELFFLKHWLKIIQSDVTINEQFAPLNRPLKDLFSQFKQIGDDLIFPDETSKKKTIKRCKQIFRWYPEEIKKCLSSLLSKTHEVIMKVAVDSYNESFNNCNVDFSDSIELEAFLEARENVLLIKPNVNNYKIEMLRLFDVFKQIRSKQNVNIHQYSGDNNFLFVDQSYLLSLFKYTEVDLVINSQLKLLFVDLLNETVNDDVSNLIKGFAKGVRKVVIVNGSNIDLSPMSSREIASPEFKFADLTVIGQQWALNKEIIKFRNETYSLAAFFNAADDDWTENSPIVNDYQFLDLLLNDRYIELKYESLNLSRLENFYIQADKDQSYSRDDFVKLIENPECDLSKSKILITHIRDRLNLQIPCDQLQKTDLNEASQYFKERCNEECSRKFYWFHYDQNVSLQQIYNPELYIPRTFYYEMVLDERKVTDSIKEQLRQGNEGADRRVTVELTKIDKRPVKCNFRANRKSDKVVYVYDGKDYNNEICDIRDFLTISRDCSLTEQELVDRGFVLITGDPGIGKSTTVTNLISKIERSCVFKLTYNDCATIVTRLNGNFEIDRISEQLLKIKTNSEFDFLKYHLAGKTAIRVVFLFDEIFDSSYDEKYERPIIEFLLYLRDETKSLIIVTCRKTKREMFENALKTFSIRFKRLKRKNVERYLTNYWKDLFHLDLKLKRLTLDGLNDYTRRLLDKATEVFARKILNFIGIPLQMKLLTEVAAPDYSSLSKENLDRISLELHPDSLTSIYEAFVEKKLAIACNKEDLRESSSSKKIYLKSIDEQLRAFSASKYGFDDDNFDESETLQVLQETGLIQGSEFIHQTIQEFYFARQIFAWLKERNKRRGDKQPELLKFLMNKAFRSWEFSIVRMFLETYVSQITPEDAPFYSRKIVEELINDSGYLLRDIFYRLNNENCQGIVIFLLGSFKKHHDQAFVSFLTVKKPFVKAILFVACKRNQTRVMDWFVQFIETQSTEMQNRIINANFYQWPAQECLNALENFIARITSASSSIIEIIDLLKKEIGPMGDIMLAAENGSLEIVRNYLTNVSDTVKPYLLNFINGSGCNGALHLAVLNDHPEMVRLLIEHGSNVNQVVNSDQLTPLDLACNTGNLEMVRLLIEHGGDYKRHGNRGVTPFHRAAEEGHVDIVKYFLDDLKYEEVNGKDWYDNSVLHSTIRRIYEDKDEYEYEDKNKIKVVEILLKHDGIDVNTKNLHGRTPLDVAVQTEKFKLIEMFVKAGSTINYDDYYDYRSRSAMKEGSNINKNTTFSSKSDTIDKDWFRGLIE